jgi:hypothetical protein
MQPGRARRAALLLAALPGVALALYPIHRPYLGLELQEHFPRNAVLAVVGRNWEPFNLLHGSALLDVLRALYTAWYALGRATGAWADRLDLLASFVADRFPFVLVGRGVVAGCALASLWLVARVGTALFGTAAGAAAVLFLGTSLLWVREAHHVWLDLPAGAAALAAVAASLRAAGRGGIAPAVVAGALGGVATATKHSVALVLLPVALAAWGGGVRPLRARAGRLAAAGGAALAVYAVLCPYTFLKLGETAALLAGVNRSLATTAPRALSLATLVHLGIGPVLPALAAIGLAAAARSSPWPSVVLASFPLAYLAMLARLGTVFGRYLAPLVPFAALFAGAGAVALARLLPGRRPERWLAAVVLLAATGPALQSGLYVAFLAEEDTRQLAGEWIQRHVPPGTPLALPNAVRYPNPVLPPHAVELRLEYPTYAAALRARGLGDPAATYPPTFLGFFNVFRRDWQPARGVVVESRHPLVATDLTPPPEVAAALRAAGAQPVAEFRGYPEPLPSGVVYDTMDADYVPLRGFTALVRPGPNITLWRLPARP